MNRREIISLLQAGKKIHTYQGKDNAGRTIRTYMFEHHPTTGKPLPSKVIETLIKQNKLYPAHNGILYWHTFEGPKNYRNHTMRRPPSMLNQGENSKIIDKEFFNEQH